MNSCAHVCTQPPYPLHQKQTTRSGLCRVQEKEDVDHRDADVQRLLDHQERQRRAVAHLHVVRLRDRRRARVDQPHHPARPPQLLERVVAHRAQLVVLGQKRLEVVRQRHRHPRLQSPRTVGEPRVVRRRHLQRRPPFVRAPSNHSSDCPQKKRVAHSLPIQSKCYYGNNTPFVLFFSLFVFFLSLFFLSKKRL